LIQDSIFGGVQIIVSKNFAGLRRNQPKKWRGAEARQIFAA